MSKTCFRDELRLIAQYTDRWHEVAEVQLREVFVKETPEELKMMKNMVQLPRMDDPVCVMCGVDSTIRCSRCKQEYYCSRDCQVKHWKVKNYAAGLFYALHSSLFVFASFILWANSCALSVAGVGRAFGKHNAAQFRDTAWG